MTPDAKQAMLLYALQNRAPTALEINRLDCENNFSDFLRHGWRHIDPAPLRWGWHLDALCDHLQAVAWGHLKKLLINVPPRTSKSSTVSVAFHPWVWAQRERLSLAGPQVQFLTTSYDAGLATRDSGRARQLMRQPWYQERWGGRFTITKDEAGRYMNDQGGYRLTTSVGGGTTGEGGNIIIVDDAHDASKVLGDADRIKVEEWWKRSMSTRLNNASTDAYIVVMQRLHEGDLSGIILDDNDDGDWTHLMIPMRYEKDRHCHTVLMWDEEGEIIKDWDDPRVYDGQLLAPDRFDEKFVSSLELVLGSYGTAGQLQQRPEPRGGGIFKRDWWQFWGNPDDEDDPAFKRFPVPDYCVASFDTAYTEKTENDFSACTVWGVFSGRSSPITAAALDRMGNKIDEAALQQYVEAPKVVLMEAWQDQLSLNDLVKRGYGTCKQYRVDRVLIEAKATGISMAQEFERLFRGNPWRVELINPGSLDKVARAVSVQPIFERGMVYAPYNVATNTGRQYAERVITNMASFPRATHDDLTDSAVQALKHLRDYGFVKHSDEMTREVADSLEHRKIPGPLYPTM